jgi:cytochrome c oxidase subunit II
MKTAIISKLVNTILFAGVCEFGFAFVPPAINLARAIEPANAAVSPKVIEINAKKYEFTPGEITLKKGEPAILRLTSSDRVHGFMSRPLKIDTDITPGKATDVAVNPQSSGQYTIICDHYCGTGHGGMKMKVNVVE